MRAQALLAPLFLCTLLGCAAGGYERSYQPFVDPSEVREVRSLASGETPKIVVSEQVGPEVKRLLSQGYVALGQSLFNGAMATDEELVAQARRVGAVLVLVNNRHAVTQTTSIPLTLPTKATGASPGGPVGGEAQLPSSGAPGGTRSATLPVVVQDERFDQQAVFFAESTRRPRCGLFLGSLSSEDRRVSRRASGAMITNIATGTPAFDADILPGDLLLAVNGMPVSDGDQAQELLKSVEKDGAVLSLTIYRRGSERVVRVTIPRRSESNQAH